MAAYSLDLRERIVDAVERGLETRSEVAAMFGVHKSLIAALAINGRLYKYKRHYREAIRGPQLVRMLRHLRRLPRAAIDSDMGPISDPSRVSGERASGDRTRDQCPMASALCAGTESGKVPPWQCQRANPEHDAGIGGRDAAASRSRLQPGQETF